MILFSFSLAWNLFCCDPENCLHVHVLWMVWGLFSHCTLTDWDLATSLWAVHEGGGKSGWKSFERKLAECHFNLGGAIDRQAPGQIYSADPWLNLFVMYITQGKEARAHPNMKLIKALERQTSCYRTDGQHSQWTDGCLWFEGWSKGLSLNCSPVASW